MVASMEYQIVLVPWWLEMLLPACLTLVSFTGALLVFESLSLIITERDSYKFRHPLTQFRWMLFWFGLTLVLAVAPDAFKHILKHDITREQFIALSKIDLYFDIISWAPCMIFAATAVLGRWRFKDALAAGAMLGQPKMRWVVINPGSMQAVPTTNPPRVNPYIELKPVAPLDWNSLYRRIVGLVGLALLSIYASGALGAAFG